MTQEKVQNTITTLTGPTFGPESGKNAKQLVVLLHGLGADGNDLIELAPYFSKQLPDAFFISPNAPFPCDMAPFGLQWFSLQERSESAILKGIEKVTPIVDNFLDEKLKELNLKDKDLILVGFSQGSMLALHVGLRRKHKICGILAYSGALVAPQLLKAETLHKTDICLVHGEEDQIVPFEAFKQANTELAKLNFPVRAYSRNSLGHGIDPAGMQIGTAFLKEIT